MRLRLLPANIPAAMAARVPLPRTQRLRGFTLSEALAALGLIAVLAGLTIGAGRHAIETTRVARARAELAILAAALEMGRLQPGRPRVLQAEASPAPGPVQLDPWGNPYIRLPPVLSGGRGRVFSAGPDGISATEDDNVRPD